MKLHAFKRYCSSGTLFKKCGSTFIKYNAFSNTKRSTVEREYLRKMLMCCLVITTQKLNPAIHHLKYIYQTYLLKLYNFLLLYFLMNVRDILKKKILVNFYKIHISFTKGLLYFREGTVLGRNKRQS